MNSIPPSRAPASQAIRVRFLESESGDVTTFELQYPFGETIARSVAQILERLQLQLVHEDLRRSPTRNIHRIYIRENTGKAISATVRLELQCELLEALSNLMPSSQPLNAIPAFDSALERIPDSVDPCTESGERSLSILDSAEPSPDATQSQSKGNRG